MLTYFFSKEFPAINKIRDKGARAMFLWVLATVMSVGGAGVIATVTSVSGAGVIATVTSVGGAGVIVTMMSVGGAGVIPW